MSQVGGRGKMDLWLTRGISTHILISSSDRLSEIPFSSLPSIDLTPSGL